MSGAIIQVKSLYKTYKTQAGEDLLALKDVSFEIFDGEFISVVGPSGCGKSTLLKILGGLLSKSGGELLLKGLPVEGPRSDIGIVFQESVLLPWRTVMQNTLLPIEIQKGHSLEYKDRALDLLKMVGLNGFEKNIPLSFRAACSKGYPSPGH